MASALELLGLAGAHQVHVAPLLLVPDLRAHQVFVGFSSELLAPFLIRHFGDCELWLVHGGAKRALTPAELPKLGQGETVVVAATQTESPGGLYGLVWVVDRLLGPGGCPWDQEQTHESLKRHLIEEAYELCQAIDEKSEHKLKEELGDVLLQPLMHAQMEKLAGRWDIDDVARTVVEKLVRRHPHVFGDAKASTAEEVLKNWDAIKKKEGKTEASVLAGVPNAMPALLRAYEVSKRAARCGFEWPDMESVWAKLHEEERELRDAVSAGDATSVAEEVGDLLFTLVNVARWAGVEPEDALRAMLDRFTSRFQAMEKAATKPLRELNATEWDELWEKAKAGVRMEAP